MQLQVITKHSDIDPSSGGLYYDHENILIFKSQIDLSYIGYNKSSKNNDGDENRDKTWII